MTACIFICTYKSAYISTPQIREGYTCVYDSYGAIPGVPTIMSRLSLFIALLSESMFVPPATSAYVRVVCKSCNMRM